MRRLLVLLVACSAPPARTPAPSPPPPAKPVAPAPDVLNLGFEDADGALPRGWSKPLKQGYEAALVGDAHGGARALQLRGSGSFGASTREAPLEPLRGKRVRLHAWIKTDAVAHGYAGLFLRADGEDQAFDNMADRGVVGTTRWREVNAEIVVPATAEKVVLGVLLVGDGTAVFDDLRLDVSDAPKPHPIDLGGSVVDAAGRPVAGAEVALIGAGGVIAARAQTDASGAFRFATMSGRWGLSAQHAGAVAAFRDAAAYDASTTVPLALGKAGTGTIVAGKVTGAHPRIVQIAPVSSHDADLFVVPVGADGSFSAELPVSDEYRVELIEDGTGRVNATRKGPRVEVTLVAAPDTPPPQAVVDWIAARAVPLATADPAHDLTDMKPLARLVGKARIVALGEATHGTREFFQLKHRFVQYLVAEHGFTVFAIEANQPECRAINEYVLRGTGDARTALAGIYFWTWNTEEVLALIEWMRAWNADPKHAKKVQFAGFDMQTANVAYKNVAAYLAQVGGDPALLALIELFAHPSGVDEVKGASPDARAKLTAGLAALAKAFDAHRKAWLAKAAGFDDIRHDITILEQALAMSAAPTPYDARDRAMAANVTWLLEHQPKGARIVLWAHNGHIANTLPAFTNMGSHLHAKYKADYLNLGFVFAQGAFQAMVGSGRNLKVKEITVGPPRPSDTSVAFSRTGKPLLVLDLRTLPKTGEVREWFAVQRPTRSIGGLFESERAMEELMSLPPLYDAVIFVDKTTRARPLAR